MEYGEEVEGELMRCSVWCDSILGGGDWGGVYVRVWSERFHVLHQMPTQRLEPSRPRCQYYTHTHYKSYHWEYKAPSIFFHRVVIHIIVVDIRTETQQRVVWDVPLIPDEVVFSELGQVVAHPGVRQTSHVVVVDSGVLCRLVQTLQCCPDSRVVT